MPGSLPGPERVDLHLGATVAGMAARHEVEAVAELAGGDDHRGGPPGEPFIAVDQPP